MKALVNFELGSSNFELGSGFPSLQVRAHLEPISKFELRSSKLTEMSQ
jgi:hypothetical protein